MQLKQSISVVIITYNNKELLKRCIASVLKSLDNASLTGYVTVVDNNSSDGSQKLIKSNFPSINYRLNNQNLGLSKALNLGIKEKMDSDYTLLLNDDVELFPDTISILVDTLNRFPKARGISAALLNPDGSPQRMKLKFFGTKKNHGTHIRYTHFSGTTACLYATEIFKELGLFDEFYFFYNEDIDFSFRMKRKGIKFVFNPEAKVIHHQSQGRSKAEKFVKPYFYATDYYFYRKNYGFIFSFVYLIMAFIHISLWLKRFRKEEDNERLLLLEKGREKLKGIVKNYKELVKGFDL